MCAWAQFRIAGRGALGRIRGEGVCAIVTLVVLGLSLLLVTVPTAAGSPRRGGAATARARHRALEAYRHDRALGAHRRRELTVPHARATVVGGTVVSIEEVPWQVA